MVKAELLRHESWLRYCFEVAALEMPALGNGKSVLNVVVAPSGFVSKSDAVLYKSNIRSFTFERCVKSSPETWYFDPHPTSKSTLTVSIAFARESATRLDPLTHIHSNAQWYDDDASTETRGIVVVETERFRNNDGIRQVVESKLSSIRYCLSRHHQNKPVEVGLSVTIRNGESSITERDIKELGFGAREADGEMLGCVCRMVERWRFPRTDVDSGRVTFRFVPHQDGDK